MADKIRLSIIATSYTMERYKDVCDLFDSIKALHFTENRLAKPFSHVEIETIFVAERSQELFDKIKAYGEKIGLPNFKMIFSSEILYLSGARTLGSKEARGDILAYVDDDSVLFPEWAEELISSYEDDSVAGVTGSAIPLWQDKQLDWFPVNYYWLISCTGWTKWNEVTEARTLWGMNMSVRKEALEKSGYFMSGLGYHQPVAEDMELSLRIKAKTGKKLLFNPRAKVWHKVYAFRVSNKFVAARAHHIGVSRRVVRNSVLKEQTNMKLEGGVFKGIIGILFHLPVDFVKSPSIAWKKFSMTAVIVTNAGIGYLFPGKDMRMVQKINDTSK